MSSVYRLGEWIVRPQRACIERGGEVVHLQPKPLAVLECLCEARGEVVTRADLFDQVWPGGVVSDATLTQCVVELRRVFGDDPRNPSVIRTIPKVGFCLVPPVEALPQEPEPSGESEGDARGSPGNRAVLWLSALAVVVMLISAWWFRSDGEAEPVSAAAPEPRAPPSIAVLPFTNLSDEPGNEYFAAGLSEELQILLSQIPRLKVSARTSSVAVREQDLTVIEIGEALNVEHVLEGSVRKSGDRVRIAVQLIEAQSGYELWSERFDRTLDDLFSVQDDVAAAVVESLRVNLVALPPEPRETRPEAYTLYLEALFFLNKATTEGRTMALDKLEQVLALDPAYAPALERLATVYLVQANTGERPFDEGFELGRIAAQQALNLEPALTSAEGLLAYIESYYDWNWVGAGTRIERMLSMPVQDANSYNTAAYYATMVGQFDRSLGLREKAIRLDPLVPLFRVLQIFSLMTVARLGEARETADGLIETHPELDETHWFQAKIRLLAGDVEGALGLLERYPLEIGRYKSLLAVVLHESGRVADARSVIEGMRASGIDEVSDGGQHYYRAQYHAWTGDADLAFEHLDRALAVKYRVLAYILGEPLFYPLHDDPRWRELLDRIGLLPFWQAERSSYRESVDTLLARRGESDSRRPGP
jgi:TolB-like protein/DNA-binding winged helix-turn-helix (wHTH) protein